MAFWFLYSSGAHQALDSFPTRRSSDLGARVRRPDDRGRRAHSPVARPQEARGDVRADRKSTRLNSSHGSISYAVFCLKKNKMPPICSSLQRGPRERPPPVKDETAKAA